MKRKLIASMLCLCMFVSLLPVAAFATVDTQDTTGTSAGSDTQQPGSSTPTDGTTGSSGSGSGDNTGASQLTELKAVATNGGSIVLNADIQLTEAITITDKAVTIDLNGHTIGVASNATIYAGGNWSMFSVRGANGSLTIKNDETSGGIVATAGDSYVADLRTGAKLEINCTNETQFIGNVVAVYVHQGSAVINGGKYDIRQHTNEAGREHSFVLNCIDKNQENGTASITILKGIIVGVDPRNTTSDPVDPTNYVASTSTVKELTTKVDCQVPDSEKCKDKLTAYEVTPSTGLVGEKGKNEETGATTVTITGTASTGKVDSENNEGVEGSNASTIKVDASADGNNKTANAQVTIPAATAQTMTEVQTVEVKANEVTVTLPKEAVSKIADATEEVTITVRTDDVSENNEVAAQYDVNVTAGEANILNGSDNGNITITVPKPANATNIFAYWVNDSGAILDRVDARISGDNVIITTGHLSKYQLRNTEVTNLPEAVYTTDSGLASGTLVNAIKDAKTGTTITLNKDVTLTDTITLPVDSAEKDITIDGKGHTISFAPNATQEMMFSFNQDDKTVTFKDVKLNPASKGFAILCKGGDVTLTDSTVTGGKSTKAVGGIYFGGAGKLTLNGTTKVSGNESNPAYNSADIWVASTASAEINGANVEVGRIFVNANTASDNPSVLQEGALAVKAGTVESVMLEANASNTAALTEAAAGTVKELLIALGDESDRPVAKITPTGELEDVQGFEVPDNQTATIIGTPDSDGKTSVTLKKAITIGTGATLTIPENTTVTVEKTGTPPQIPTITNNGSLIVDGSLIAGSTASDSDKLTFTGNGAVTGSGTIDVDKTNTATVKLDVAGGTGVDSEYTVIITSAASGAKATFVLPIPTRAGYEFQGWKDSTGATVTSVELAKDDEASFTAQWKLISSGNTGGGGGSSASVSVPSAANGKVTVSNSNAKKGDTVTITLTPNTGYVVDTVTVTDSKGNAVEVSKTDDTHYTFVMPDGRVTVKATFKQSEVTPPPTGFTDVPADAYYADAVKWAVDNGITNGLTATTFGPNNSCTRGQMVTFLWRAAGSPAATGTNSFSDVASGEYYYNAVLWAVEKGITNGTSATTFSPNATVNRGQTVTFLYRYAESPAATGDTSFTDVAADAFYADAVKWAVAEGITNGTSDTTFAPASNCTRGQIVTFMYRQMAE